MEGALLDWLNNIESLKEYGSGLYLGIVFIGGVVLCYGGWICFKVVAFVVGAIIGGTLGGILGAGGDALALYQLIGALVGGVLCIALITLGVFVLGMALGASLALAAGGEQVMTFVAAFGIGFLAVFLFGPFVIVVTAISGALALTYGFSNLIAFWSSGELAFDRSFAGYSQFIVGQFQDGGYNAVQSQVMTDLILFVLISISGIVVQFYVEVWRNKRKMLNESKDEQSQSDHPERVAHVEGG